jgi:hypothetical protein
MAKLFSIKKQEKLFKWTDVKTFFVRTQYNEMLKQVLQKDAQFITDGLAEPYRNAAGEVLPNYYNPNLNLALVRGICNVGGLTNLTKTAAAEADAKKAKATGDKSTSGQTSTSSVFDNDSCFENDNDDLLALPAFLYDRTPKVIKFKKEDGTPDTLDALLKLDTQLNFGAVLWLYYYERMGVFEILKALMNDYNYAGKYPISGKSENITTDVTLQYTALMDTVSTLYRLGIGSNLLDRKTLYQRVLGVTFKSQTEKESSPVISEKNDGFMRNFNKLISYTIDFYRDKQLAQAIRDTNTQTVRSSVATQTAIRDTILVLQKNFEVFEYGRNRINTFTAIATVFATICLLRMIKDEIGVPRQYNEPHEFISAAYDILVSKTPVTQSESNRFTIFDNCASYGYRLLTDIELIEPESLNTVAIGSVLDAWLNDIEGNVEGYNNAVKSIPETERAMAMA